METRDNRNPELERLERLSEVELRAWLRRVIWTQNTSPLAIPPTDLPIPYLINLFKRKSPQLTVTLRAVIPSLLQEWGQDDSADALDSLLVLCGALRCAEAEPMIALIAMDRLSGLPFETSLRQRCLSVLSGFGCTTRTESLFKSFIRNIDYAALCYRALYRYDLGLAASELPALVKIHEEAKRLLNLEAVLDILFFHYATPDQRSYIWLQILGQSGLDVLSSLLQSLQKTGIFVSVDPMDSTETLEVLYRRGHAEAAVDRIHSSPLSDEVILVISHSAEEYLVSNELDVLVASATDGQFLWK